MNYLDRIKSIINEKLKPEKISIIDNSALHAKHKFYNSEKFHLKLIIQSKKLKNMKKNRSSQVNFFCFRGGNEK